MNFKFLFIVQQYKTIPRGTSFHDLACEIASQKQIMNQKVKSRQKRKEQSQRNTIK